MSLIYRLQIRGIRSFDPDTTEQIQFGKPLTVITGQNGSGKTTIIECLKYATTGDLPPNSKGGAFIHDPKITGEREVRAQVKLGFKNARGISMTTTRTMQLLVKKTATTFKTLEGQLVAINKGERATISTKCAELDTQIPLYLGVSKAILEYVIFCHQEDSLWPLSEPAVLKKRFDEIFEALKFTKALDTIKAVRKDMAVEVKLLEQSVQHLKGDKERADKAKARVAQIVAKINAYSTEIADVSAKAAEISAKSDALFASNQEFQAVLSQLDTLKRSEASLESQITRLTANLEILTANDKALLAQLANSLEIMAEKVKQVGVMKGDLAKASEKLTAARVAYSHAISEEGQLKAAEAKYFGDLAERNALVRANLGLVSGSDSVDIQISPKGISDGTPDGLTDEEVDNFLLSLTQRLETLRRKHAALVAANESARNDLLDQLKVLGDSKMREEQHRLYQVADIRKIEALMDEIQIKLNALLSNEGSIAYEKSLLEEYAKKLLDFQAEDVLGQLAADVRSGQTRQGVLEAELEELQKKFLTANRQFEIHGKINWLKEDGLHRQNALKALVESTREKVEAAGLTMADSVAATEVEVRASISRALAALATANASGEDVRQAISSVESSSEYSTNKVAQLKQLLAATRAKIYQTLPEDVSLDEYDTYVRELEEDYQEALEAEKLDVATNQFILKALEIARENHACALCRRGFTPASPEYSQFIMLLAQKTDAFAQTALQGELEELKRELAAVRSVERDIAVWRSTEAELPEAEARRTELATRLAELASDKDAAERACDTRRRELAALDALRVPLGEILGLEAEASKLSAQLSEMQDSLKDFGGSSVDELMAQQQDKSQTLREVRIQLNLSLELKDVRHREQLRLENNVKDKRLTISNLERELVERDGLSKTLDECLDRAAELRESVAKTDGVLVGLQKEFTATNERFEAFMGTSAREEEVSQTEVEAVSRVHGSVETLGASVSAYLARDAAMLAVARAEVGRLAETIAALETRTAAIAEDITRLERSIADTDNTERVIRSNLDLRAMETEAAAIAEQIARLDVQKAEAARERYQEESRALRDEYTVLNAQHAGKSGEIRQMEDQVAGLRNELISEYKDVEELYRREWVRLQVKSLSSSDLGNYSLALDKAIMQYHGVKMKEVNRIVDELWKKTYSGTDVDTILIRSDVNTQAKGNRSYNYRVVMVKQDVELDMRGRCSAGQKMLACIIIRMALAECFGVNCGMIALDEPTTNLDAENIEALARALNLIISVRRNQKNFQLIVITHDEKFLAHMGAVHYTDVFYRVQRNERQKSQIQQLSINHLNE
ncbi:hypothetical protein BABINDRAFT_161278 [Babjeviella inositovora NRRL Y-12698]|uniref:DNA repair protein RAD50 n=1 Tax=Babjeviella inositovora NRRL Y-12698 TaxID=984486 RepID=A0A1E3QS44_9ASCO|nr:uncharacterized protein BABINDRAFT_161278 [Babjeviella inositovora NRRL Y-12698]ODQ80324.1 hypothetical protein BABINDRAFT_161278 [Babjeviella inositovora NRRL Y-12698]